MSKRGADTELTKAIFEQQGPFNFAGGQKNPVTFASEQTMSNRKIAQPRGRLGRSTGSRGPRPPAVPSANPFGNLSGAQENQPQQTFGAVNSNGFTFGGGNTNNTSTGFAFSAPSSISFGFGQTTAPPNPFSNSNGPSTSFQDDSLSVDAMMESPQKKQNTTSSFGAGSISTPFSFNQQHQPQPASSGFGFSQSTNTPGNTGGLFSGMGNSGQTSVGKLQSKPTFSVGSSSNPPNSPGGLFDSVSKPESSSSGPAGSAPLFSFSQGQNPLQPSANPFSFVQPTSTPPTQSSSFTFGEQSTSQPSSSSTVFGQNHPQSSSFTFGETQPKSQSSNIFGGLSTSKPEEKTSAPLFGNSTTTSAPSSNLFGHSTSGPSTIGNIFGPASLTAADTENKNSTGTSSQPSNPFGGLFGQTQAVTEKASETPKPAATPKTPFAFGQTAQAPNPFFAPTTPKAQNPIAAQTPGTAKSTATSVASDSSLPSGLSTGSPAGFSFGGRSMSQQEQTPKPNSTQLSGFSTDFGASSSQAEPIKGSPTGDLFGRTSRLDQDAQDSAPEQNKTPSFPQTSNVFGAKDSPSKEASTEKEPIKWGGGKLFEFGPKTPQVTPAPVESNRSKTPSTAFKPQPSSSAFTHSQSKPLSALNQGTPSTSSLIEPATGTDLSLAKVLSQSTSTSAKAGQAPKVRPRTRGPSYFNSAFSPNDHLENDKSYRLRSLDREFAQQVLALDFQKHDFGNLVLYYVEVRESIGRPIGGLYARVTAGMKRKADDPHGQHEETQGQVKRARAEASPETVTITKGLQHTATPPSDVDSSTKSTGPVPATSTSSLFQSIMSTPTADSTKNAPAVPASAPAKNMFSSVKSTSSGASSIVFKPSSSFDSAPNPDLSSNPFAAVAKVGQSKTSQVTSFDSSSLKPLKPSTTPTKSPPKKPAFELPKFDASASTNMFASFGAQAQEQKKKDDRKRMAEELDSDEETEEEYKVRAQQAAKNREEQLKQIPRTGFKPSVSSKDTSASPEPSFSFNANPSQTMAFQKTSSGPIFTFGSTKTPPKQSIEISEDERKSSQGSGEDDEEDGDYEEGDDEDMSDEVSDEEDTGDNEDVRQDEEEDDSGDDLQTAMNASQKRVSEQNKGKSLFDRIEKPSTHDSGLDTESGVTEKQQGYLPNAFTTSAAGSNSPILQDAPNNSFKGFPVGANIFQSTPKAPTPSPFTPVNGMELPKQPIELAKTFNYTPPTTTPTPVQATSVLFGAQTRTGPIPGEGLFGSRPSTPNPEEKPAPAASNVFASLSRLSAFSPRNDNTWKAGTPIKFGTPEKSDDGPVVNITAATPPAKDDASSSKPFTSLFGSNSTSDAKDPSNSGSGLGFGFSPAPGFLGAASHLIPSANSSAVSSRATSPGATDNESVATNDTEDLADDPQTSLMSSRPGEENEDVLFEARSKALKFYDEEMAKGTKAIANQYNSVGVGELRVLKSRVTSKTRIVLRTEPSSNILINTNLLPTIAYKSHPAEKTGSVFFPIANGSKMEKWVLKLKTKAMGDELARILEDNKA